MAEITLDLLADSPVGPIWLAASPAAVVEIALNEDEEPLVSRLAAQHGVPVQRGATELTERARTALQDYFNGNSARIELPLKWDALTPFQADVLRKVAAIPYGQLRTYQDIARSLGKTGAAQAVGHANGANPFLIVVPCHRVVGNDGTLHGYRAGVETKAWLLRHEGS